MSNKPLPVKINDVVEVLPGCTFQGLVYSKGIVRESLRFMFCVVEFPAEKYSSTGLPNETLQGRYWCVPWKYLRVVESAYDDKLGQMEEEILGLEADLVVARSCIAISEELREHQAELIRKLVEDVDVLRKELYLARGS